METKLKTTQSARTAWGSSAIALVILSVTALGWAGESTIFTFSSNNGTNPNGTMVMDAAGNLYGVTTTGGLANCFGNTCGVVFKLTPSPSGHWTEAVLHRFTGGSDGYFPNSLIMDSAGNLYGTTPYGGGNGGQCNSGTGCGIVFKLSPRPTGPWPETVLYRFSGTDGANPDALAFDSQGNLFGTTGNGGGGSASCASVELTGCGVLFQLTPTPSGPWTLTTVHTFLDTLSDGPGPQGLVFGPGGTIYGISSAGGSNGQGCVFQLVQGTGGWTFSLIHSFGSGDGLFPNSRMIFDSQGNLFGTTPEGGTDHAGVVFELSPSSGGTWTENILYNFQFGTGGYSPHALLAFDAAGNLYGTAFNGGGNNSRCTNGCGTTFKLTPSGSGTWTQSVVFRFVSTNGGQPAGGLVQDAAGNFYGTASIGGAANDGLVFKFVP